MERKIIHIDMDAFFASVEQRDHPELQGKPVAVGGSKERGVVAAASYEARKYGVRSAMSSRLAYQKCPHIVFVKHRFDVYKEVSRQIREIFYEYTDLVEPLSLDEAFIEVTQNKFDEPSAIKIASEIKQKIKEKTLLTASAGVSVNKFLAKVASDLKKPDGLAVILPHQVLPFLEELPIEKFFGVGKATAEKMKNFGIKTGKDLKVHSRLELAQRFGKFGSYLYDVVRGIDNRKVKPDRIRKSISSETTYSEDLMTLADVKSSVRLLIGKLCQSCVKYGIKGKTINLKYRFNDFTTFTRSRTLGGFTNDMDIIIDLTFDMLMELESDMKPIRLLGIGLSSLNTERKDNQLEFDFNINKKQ
ncbi:MAG: DNA polymerase IV [Saprospiraceae bacterium]|nr:DNA polymerase IV [Saprospiraceae bacterium]